MCGSNIGCAGRPAVALGFYVGIGLIVGIVIGPRRNKDSTDIATNSAATSRQYQALWWH